MSNKYYNPYDHKAREGQNLKRFKMTDESGTKSVTLVEDPGPLIQEGTPLSAEVFNEKEYRINSAFTKVQQDMETVLPSMKILGEVSRYSDLPSSPNNGDTYIVTGTFSFYTRYLNKWWKIGGNSGGDQPIPTNVITKKEGVQLVFSLPDIDPELTGQYFLLLSDTDPSHEYGHIYQLVDNAGTLEWQDYPLGSGGGGYGNDYCIAVTHTDSMPTTRPDGKPLKIGDTVYPVPSESFPFTISGYEFVDMSYEFTYAIKLDGTYTWVYKSGTKSTEDLLEQIKEQARIATSASTTAQTASTTSQTYAGQSIQARNDTLAYKDETKKLVQWGSLEDYNARLDAGQIEDYTAFFLIPPMGGS